MASLLRTSETGSPVHHGVKVAKSILVNRRPEELYLFWRSLENLPLFINHLESVTVMNDILSHWIMKGAAHTTFEWDSEIINDHPGELIAWKSLPGSDVQNAGTVRFETAPGARGTLVRFQIEYVPPAGVVGNMLARIFIGNPEEEIEEDLRRLKWLMEAGEMPTTEGQTAARGEHLHGVGK